MEIKLTNEQLVARINELNNLKKGVMLSFEKDAEDAAERRYNAICRKRNGKFKISEKQFLEELKNVWIAAEFTAFERVLRRVELDPDLNSRDLMIGDLQETIIEAFAVLKRNLDLKGDVTLESLIDGKYSINQAQ